MISQEDGEISANQYKHYEERIGESTDIPNM